MSLLTILRDWLMLASNIRRIADNTAALQQKYAPPQPPDPRYTSRLQQSDK